MKSRIALTLFLFMLVCLAATIPIVYLASVVDFDPFARHHPVLGYTCTVLVLFAAVFASMFAMPLLDWCSVKAAAILRRLE